MVRHASLAVTAIARIDNKRLFMFYRKIKGVAYCGVLFKLGV
jgi:hypothetical protein